MPLKVSAEIVNQSLSAAGEDLNSGYLRLYSGTRPASTDHAITGTLLAELRFANPAFGAPSAGSMSANALTGDSAADASGTATHYRAWKSDGTTAVIDGDVGTAGSDLNLNSVAISAGAQVDVTSFVLTMSRG